MESLVPFCVAPAQGAQTCSICAPTPLPQLLKAFLAYFSEQIWSQEHHLLLTQENKLLCHFQVQSPVRKEGGGRRQVLCCPPWGAAGLRERAALPGASLPGAQMHFFLGGVLSVVGRKGKKPVWRSDLLKMHSIHTSVVSQLHLATAEVAFAAWLRSGWREAFPFCPPLPPPSSFSVSCWAIEMHFRKCVCMMCVHVSVCTPLVFWHIIAFLCFEEQDCKALEQ